MFVTLLVFLAIIGLLVFVHELGHFLAAKRAGVLVHEFAFGFRPRLIAKKIGETLYAINLLPFGGYVRLYGEKPEETGERAFTHKTIWQRFLIMVAGSTMNLLLGWLILTGLFIFGFQPIFPGVADNPFVEGGKVITISRINSNSPAEAAGLKAGDKITGVDNEQLSTEAFIRYVNGKKNQPINLNVVTDGQNRAVTLTPRENPPPGEGVLGVALVSGEKVQTSVIAAPAASLYETGRLIGVSAQGFVLFVRDLVITQKVSEDVTGLIGVGALTGVARRLGIEYLAQLVIMISIGLGVLNLMPIMPLDGGHIAALAYEKVAGRSLSEKQIATLASIGLAFVLLIFVIVTAKDILRFRVFDRLF